MLKLKRPVFGTSEDGDEVFMSTGDFISEISDAGPVHGTMQAHNADGSYSTVGDMRRCEGWNVSCVFTPSHKLWTEIVTIDAVKLLKALEGVE